MNTISENMNLKIVYEVDGGLAQNATKNLIASQLTTYESFIDLLNKTMTLDPNFNYLIFLNDQNEEKLALDKDSFDKIKEIVLAQTSEDEVYLLLQQADKKSLNTTSHQNINVETNKALEDYWTTKVKPFLDPLIASMLLQKPENSVIIILILIGTIHDRKLGQAFKQRREFQLTF